LPRIIPKSFHIPPPLIANNPSIHEVKQIFPNTCPLHEGVNVKQEAKGRNRGD